VNTVLEMQPRMSGGGGAGASDDTVYELAAMMLQHIVINLDIDDAKREIFEVAYLSLANIESSNI